MAKIIRLTNPNLDEVGMDPFVERGPIPVDINHEILNSEQQFTDNSIPGQKVTDLPADKLLTGVLRVTTSISSFNYVPGVSGWYFDGAGNADFPNITFANANADIFSVNNISPTETGEVRWYELASNGTNYFALRAADSMASTLGYSLPAAAGRPGDTLKLSASAAELNFAQPYSSFSVASGSAVDADWSLGNVMNYVIDQNVTIDLVNPEPASDTPAKYMVFLTQDGTGGWTVTFTSSSGSLLWRGGTPPTFTATAGATDIVTLVWNGGSYYADASQNFS